MSRRVFIGPIQARLLEALRMGPATALELTRAAHRSVGDVRQALRGPLRRGTVVRVGEHYCLPDSPLRAALKAEQARYPVKAAGVERPA